MVVETRFGGFLRGAARGVGAALALALAGCSGGSGSAAWSGTPLAADDFRSADALEHAPPPPIPTYAAERPTAPRVEIQTLSEEEARGEIGDVSVDIGNPVVTEPAPASERPVLHPSDFELVDAKVGDINGRPILARVWLEPLGARLSRELAGKPHPEWRNESAKIISERLIGDLSDELYLAEARASLTPEQKAGLRVFLQRFERDVVRSAYGSETLADLQMRQTSNMSLEQAKREREKTTLILEQLRTKVWDRVQVSQRDLELEYERNYDKYNPPPQAIFLLIQLRTAEAGTIAEFSEMLSTTPFPTVAADKRNGSQEPQPRSVPEGLETADLFSVPALQEAASKLTPGAFAGPIEVGPFTYWVYLDHIEKTSHSLYDVQLELRNQITAERREEEARRYLFRLFDRAGIRGIDELTVRLVDIAERWYYEPEAK